MNAQSTLASLTDHMTLYQADVSHLLPTLWREKITRCSERSSAWRVLTGGSTTSREESFEEQAVAEVGVVTGDVIARNLPWLDGLYREKFLDLANSLSRAEYTASSDARAGTNINTTQRGARYEWHIDSNPLTGLLFVTTLTPDDGGQLLMRPDPQSRPDSDWEISISPTAGHLLLFDARHVAHVVTPLAAERRISVPMNYYFADGERRPGDLDAYLYE